MAASVRHSYSSLHIIAIACIHACVLLLTLSCYPLVYATPKRTLNGPGAGCWQTIGLSFKHFGFNRSELWHILRWEDSGYINQFLGGM